MRKYFSMSLDQLWHSFLLPSTLLMFSSFFLTCASFMNLIQYLILSGPQPGEFDFFMGVVYLWCQMFRGWRSDTSIFPFCVASFMNTPSENFPSSVFDLLDTPESVASRGLDGWIPTPLFEKKLVQIKKLFKMDKVFELKKIFSTPLQKFWLRHCPEYTIIRVEWGRNNVCEFYRGWIDTLSFCIFTWKSHFTLSSVNVDECMCSVEFSWFKGLRKPIRNVNWKTQVNFQEFYTFEWWICEDCKYHQAFFILTILFIAYPLQILKFIVPVNINQKKYFFYKNMMKNILLL